MNILRKWSDTILTKMGQLPIVGRLSREARRGVLLGACAGALLLLLAGGTFGSVNRGWPGMVVGAISGALLGLIPGGITGAIIGSLHPSRQRQSTLSIKLSESSGRYALGETVSGYIEIEVKDSLKTKGGTVSLICRGFYMHDTSDWDSAGQPEFAHESVDYVTQEANVIPAAPLRKGSSLRYPFQFVLPSEGLPTHHGYACSVHWTLHATLETPDSAPIKARQELMVEAMTPAVQPAPEKYRSATTTPTCELTLILPNAVVAEGDAVSARADISPGESFDADGVRAVLLRIETLPEGDDHTVYVRQWDPASGSFQGNRQPGGKGTTYVWLEDEVQLSKATRFEMAKPISFPFSLGVPAQWRPTFESENGQVLWKVGVIIARANAPDIRAFHEIVVHTGIPQITPVLASPAHPADDAAPPWTG